MPDPVMGIRDVRVRLLEMLPFLLSVHALPAAPGVLDRFNLRSAMLLNDGQHVLDAMIAASARYCSSARASPVTSLNVKTAPSILPLPVQYGSARTM